MSFVCNHATLALNGKVPLQCSHHRSMMVHGKLSVSHVFCLGLFHTFSTECIFRGMELSDLCYFDHRLYTFDDRTGIVYEVAENSGR